jgi:cbb3-type cytochrome oxidase subunit 3
MAEEDWKQSAVMFYAFGTIATLLIFAGVCIWSLYKNRTRKRNVQKILCWCCIKDPMTEYDTIHRADDDIDMAVGLKREGAVSYSITSDEDEEEIEIDIHDGDDPPMRTLANQFELDSSQAL